MKTLAIVVLVLALASIACSSEAPPAPPAAAPQVAAPQVAVPTGLTVDDVVAFVSGQGMTYMGYDARGDNECGSDYCVHFSYGSGQGGPSLYLDGGRLAGTLVAIPVAADDATIQALAYAEGAIEMEFWPAMTQQEMSCIESTKIGDSVQCGRFFSAVVVDGDWIYVILKHNVAQGTSFGPSA